MTEAVAAGQESGREAVRGGEDHLNRAGGRQVWAKPGPRLGGEDIERTDRDRSDRQQVFLEDNKADMASGGSIDAIPAEELFDRECVVRRIGLTQILGERPEAARVPPTPTSDQGDAE